MIGALKGRWQSTPDNGEIVVWAGDVGYLVHVSAWTLDGAIHEGVAQLALWITTIVAETKLDLFGFRDRGEQELFDILRTVQNVGPAKAMRVLGLGWREVRAMLIAGDAKSLTKADGVGAKLAEKLVETLQVRLRRV